MTTQTFITDAKGNELQMGDPAAAIHFTLVGHIQDGQVWRADEIKGRGLRHRLTFSSYYRRASGTGHTLGFLLWHQMHAHEATAAWELKLAAEFQLAAAAA